MTLEKIKSVLRPIKKLIQSLLFKLTLPIKHFQKLPLKNFQFDYFSQNGEDGVVEEIFRRLKISSGWMVEFGAWDGVYASNTFHFLKTHPQMKAVYIEGDKDRYGDLLKTASIVDNRIIPLNAFVMPTGNNCLDELLGRTSIPNDFDLLSIDIDSFDYQVWDGLKKYKPKVVIIEINCSIPVEMEQVHNKEQGKQGSSFLSTLRLGNSKGYTCVHHKGNMFFVRNDLLKRVGVQNLTEDEQKSLFIQKGSIYQKI